MSRQEPRPHALHADDASCSGSFEHLTCLPGGLGERLLDQHRLAGFDRGQGVTMVVAVRGRHVDDVDVVGGHQLVQRCRDPLESPLVSERLGTLPSTGVAGHQTLVGVRAEVLGQQVGGVSGADEPPAQRRGVAGIGHSAGGQADHGGQSTRRQRRRAVIPPNSPGWRARAPSRGSVETDALTHCSARWVLGGGADSLRLVSWLSPRRPSGVVPPGQPPRPEPLPGRHRAAVGGPSVGRGRTRCR